MINALEKNKLGHFFQDEFSRYKDEFITYIDTLQIRQFQGVIPLTFSSDHVNEIKNLLDEIKKETENIFLLFWTSEELREIKEAADFLEKRIQAMMRATINNLEWYRNEGWRKFPGEDEQDE